MQTLGIIDLVWKGRKLAVEKGAKVMIGGVGNTPVVYGRQVGRAQEFLASEITATVPLERGRAIGEIYTLGEGELQVLCDTGHTYTWPDAFLVGRPTATGGEGGKIELKWAAGEPEELING